MDGSVSASAQSTERTRQHLTRLFGNRASSSVNSELFEQLLGIPLPAPSQPTRDDSTVAAVDSLPSAENTHTKGRKAESRREEQKDEPESAAATPLPALAPVQLNTQPAATSELTAVQSENAVLSSDLPQPVAEAVVTATVSEAESIPDASAEVSPAPVTAAQSPVPIETESSGAAQQFVDERAQTSAVKVDQKRSDRAGRDNANQPLVLPQPAAEASVQSAAATETEPVAQPDARPIAQEQDAAVQSSAKPVAELEDKSSRTSRREKWFERDVNPVDSQDQTSNPIESSAHEPPPIEALQGEGLATLATATPLPYELALDVTTQATASTTIAAATAAVLPNTQAAGGATGSAATSTVAESGTGSSKAGNVSSLAREGGEFTSKISTATRSEFKDQANRPELTQQERVRLIQRVSRSFSRLTSAGGLINLRLHPQNLGSLNMQVRIEGRTLSAKLTTETTAARDAILQDLPALRQRLADQGYDVAKFQVEVAGNGSDASFAQTGGQSPFSQSGGSGYQPGGQDIDYRRLASRNARLLDVTPAQASSQLSLSARSGIDVQA